MNPTSETVDLARFDVRDIPCRVKHAQIFQRWANLPVAQHFVLINDHDPVPLWYQFVAQFPDAFEWEYLLRGPDEFQVKITKLRAVTMPAEMPRPVVPAGLHSCGSTAKFVEVDARGLEPPEPLMRILNALETLHQGERLRAITDRQPCHLFGEAQARGFRHECTEQPDRSWVTLLRRA
jgi:uncharacterized protein (DUF2249 family)